MDNPSFEYTYSAQQQQEVEAIRQKYLPKQEDKMERLRALHRIPTKKANTRSIAIGTIGALILGTGMSLIMSEFGLLLGSYAMAVGIGAGLVGLALVALAYPAYNHTLKKERQKIAPEILRLTDELMQ